MGAASRTKGRAGEQELARLLTEELGPVGRNLLQTRAGGHDLEGPALRGWALEVKRYHRATPALLTEWWQQAEQQARSAGRAPCLAWRSDREPWRVLVPLSVLLPELPAGAGLDWTVAVSVPAFAALVRERLGSFVGSPGEGGAGR
jgi:Holliday junction resolvase